MAEWSIAADCKSVLNSTVVRIHPSPPSLGLKVFTDAHDTVTVEEGDRYPLGPPSLFLGSTVGSCAALLMPMSEVRAFPGEPNNVSLM